MTVNTQEPCEMKVVELSPFEEGGQKERRKRDTSLYCCLRFEGGKFGYLSDCVLSSPGEIPYDGILW